ncbi:MAG: co-chaperone DjlA [Gammaproteobacteria bacterium]|nr:co-chaperone DjlA [Gammaproteobacteria bacterium]
MAWWGKFIGGGLGFLMGGPLAAVLGAALGHQFDVGLQRIAIDPPTGGNLQERIQAAFFTATFSVMGHIAKADGRVSDQEIALARQLMAEMQLSSDQRRAAIALFDQGKQSDFPLDDVLEQFRHECHRRSTLVRMFLELQIRAALADGRLDPAENRILRRAAERLGISRREFEALLQFIGGIMHDGAGRHVHRIEDDYKVLGVTKAATDAEVKKAYRRLMSQHHPDKLVSKGLPEEMMKVATETTHEIRSAYERVMEARKV